MADPADPPTTPGTPAPKYDVFLSYRRQEPDKGFARKLLRDLEAAGYTVAIDERDFRPNIPFLQEMERCVTESRFTLAVVTPRYLDSGNTEEEGIVVTVQDMRDRRRRLIPLYYEKTQVPDWMYSLTGVRFDDPDPLVPPLKRLTGALGPPSLPPPPPARTPAGGLWMVPYARNPFFTAREDALAALQTALASGRPAAVTGLGGIGKTQTAVEYAYRHRGEYQYVLWAGAADDAALREGFAEIARRLELPQAQEKDRNLAVSAVKDWLAGNAGWLLTLDNADDLSQASGFLPAQGRGHVLLTTRASATGAVAQAAPLTKLSDDDGALLLLRRAKRVAENADLESATPEDRDAARTLAREVDGLPLALDQAGAYIEETPSSPARYLALYQEQAADVLAEYGDGKRDHASVSVTYSLAFAQVAAASPAAGELVRCCAFLAPDAIPEEVFTDGEAALNAGPGPFGATGLAWDKIVRAACRFSLLSRDPDGGGLSIHRLVQTVTQHELDEAARRAYAERMVRAVNHVFPDVNVSDWPLCERLLPHAQACAEHIHTYGLESEAAARLLHQAGFYLIERAQYAAAEPLYERAQAMSEKVLGPEHPDAIISLNNLADLYETQGRYAEAETLFKKALATSKKVLGPEHPTTVIILNGLASLLYAQGRYEAAEPLYKRTLSVREKALRSENPGTPGTLNNLRRSLNNLGNLYRSQGKFAEARPRLERALAISEEVQGPEHPDTARSLSNLANLYQAQGDADDALRLYERARTIFEKSLGPEHPDTLTNLNNLANLYHAQNRYAEAEPLLERVLATQEKVQGPEHPDTAAALNNLAALYYDQGRYAEAQPLYERARTISEKVRGPEHPDTARSLNNLAILYDAQGRSADAEPLLKRALAIFEKVLGPEHPDTVGARQTYADLLAKLNK